MSENVVVITFPDRNAVYEASTALKNAVVGYEVEAVAIVERGEDGTVRLADAADDKGGWATLGGSLIGMLIGAFGGPLGMLLGVSVGAVGGAVVDASRDDDTDDVLTQFAATVPPGTNALVAETVEDDAAALDSFVSERGGSITRWTLDEVLDVLDAQEVAQAQAADAAREALHDQRKAERKQSREERLAALKAKFHHKK